MTPPYVPNALNTLEHHQNAPNRSKTIQTPVKASSYRCFRSVRPQVRDGAPDRGGARELPEPLQRFLAGPLLHEDGSEVEVTESARACS